MCWRTSSAVSLAEGSLERGMKWTILLKRLTTVRMTVWPLDVGRPVTKWAMRNRQWMQETGWWMMRGLVLVAHRTGIDIGHPPPVMTTRSTAAGSLGSAECQGGR